MVARQHIPVVEGFDPTQSAGLFVGIRQFDDGRFAEVPYAVDDAVDLAHLFALELDLMAPDNVVLALSGEPQKQESVSRREDLLARGTVLETAGLTSLYRLFYGRGQATGPKGLFVASVATHGVSAGGSGFLVAADSLSRLGPRTGIAVDQLFDDGCRATAPRRIVLLDACRERLWTTRAGGADPEAAAMGQSFATAIAAASGIVVLFATTQGGYAYDDDKRGNGVFTAAIIDGLQGQAAADERSLITVQTLAHYVHQRVLAWVKDNVPQHLELSRGIALQIEEGAKVIPLAVDPARRRAVQEYCRRRAAALERLKENIGGPLSGRLYDDIAGTLAPDRPGPELLELLEEVEALDGSVRSRRSLAHYFNEHRSRLIPAAKAPAVISSSPKVSDVWQDPVLGIRFRYVPAGRFEMGSPQSEADRDDDETLHEVELTHGFWIGETVVTQGEWRRLMGNNPSEFTSRGDDHPVENVNWYEAVAFANALSQKAGFDSCYELSGASDKVGGQGLEFANVRFKGLERRGYRLPTEAEWEYAARAGTATPFWTGGNLTTAQANYDGRYPYAGHPKGEYREQPVAVRSFGDNPWGLYEVHGNIWEWVWDCYGEYPKKPVKDPTEPVKDPTDTAPGSDRVFRGGGWSFSGRNCRAAKRLYFAPRLRNGYLGFRLVRTAE